MTKERTTSLDELNATKKQIDELRKRLNSLDSEKEEWFKKREQISSNIVKLIKVIKIAKRSRDKLTAKVRNLKKKREELNNQIKEKISTIKKKSPPKQDFSERRSKREKVYTDPKKIKQEIDDIEMRIQTEVTSFKKEQELMIKIKELKVILKEVGQSGVLSEEIDKIKKRSNEIHAEIQKVAKESQKDHEKIVTTSKEIDKLRVSEKEDYNNFAKSKQEFVKVSEELNKTLVKLGEINNKLGGSHSQINAAILGKKKTGKERGKSRQKSKAIVHKEEIDKKKLKEKTEEVEEKIKKRQKLTTEDLLAFQTKEGTLENKK